MWFVDYFYTKQKRRSEAKPVACSLDNDVWVRCLKIASDGILQPSKVQFRKLPLKKLNHSKRIVSVSDGRLSAFNERQFAKLKREILSDLEAELQEDSLRKESLRKKRLVDMNLPIGVMHKSEVYEECAKRLNVNENDLPSALKPLGLQLGFSEDDCAKLLLPTLRKILEHLRKSTENRMQ